MLSLTSCSIQNDVEQPFPSISRGRAHTFGRRARRGTAACAAPNDDTVAGDDQTFVQLREAARRNDAAKAAQLASMIPNYPVPSYVEYFQIKPQLFDSTGRARVDAPDAPVQSFLQRYDGQAIADRLRNDYLLVLGARHDWRNFDEQYKRFVLDDDTQVKCYALESRARARETSPKRRVRCSSSRRTTATRAST